MVEAWRTRGSRRAFRPCDRGAAWSAGADRFCRHGSQAARRGAFRRRPRPSPRGVRFRRRRSPVGRRGGCRRAHLDTAVRAADTRGNAGIKFRPDGKGRAAPHAMGLRRSRGVPEIEARTAHRVGRSLAALGVKERPEPAIRPGSDTRAVRIVVDGVEQLFPPSFLTRLWFAVAPRDLRELAFEPAPGQRDGGQTWLVEIASSLQSLERDDARQTISDLVEHLTAEVLSPAPGLAAGAGRIGSVSIKGPGRSWPAGCSWCCVCCFSMASQSPTRSGSSDSCGPPARSAAPPRTRPRRCSPRFGLRGRDPCRQCHLWCAGRS